MDQWLTLEQISEELKLHIETVRTLVRTKQLPAYKVGRAYRVKQSDYEAFLAKRRTIDETY